jgi:threonine dehydrogenase-like Zn-dependent dehydrogenase
MTTTLYPASVYRLESPGRLVLDEESLDISSLPADGVAARTLTSVISPGTETAAFAGAPPLRPGKAYPRLVGYCNVAEVVAVGREVTDVKPGDRIATERSHRSAFVCPRARVLARLAPDADAAAAATTYLFCLGQHALLRADARSETNVAVVGLGAVGLAAVAVARTAGCRVVAFSDQPFLRDKALRFGAHAAVGKDEGGAGAGIDVVVTTSNRWSDWRLALDIARAGGTIAVLGFPGRTEGLPPFNPLASQYLYDKQLSVIACGKMVEAPVAPHEVPFTLHRIYAHLLGLIGEGRLPGAELVSEVIPWRELESAYRRLSAREPGLVTLALDWR